MQTGQNAPRIDRGSVRVLSPEARAGRRAALSGPPRRNLRGEPRPGARLCAVQCARATRAAALLWVARTRAREKKRGPFDACSASLVSRQLAGEPAVHYCLQQAHPVEPVATRPSFHFPV